jgi:hypothetical protein
MTRIEKRWDKEQGHGPYHTINVSDSRDWMQFRSAICNTYSVYWADLGTSHVNSISAAATRTARRLLDAPEKLGRSD